MNVTDMADPVTARELWSSFVSLMRSYTAAHGLNKLRQAVLEVSDGLLLVRVGDHLLTARFDGERGSFSREASSRGTQFTLDQKGRMVLYGGPEMSGVAEEMDIVAERLAREIMR